MPRADADYPVRGYEYYDFIHHVVNTKFVNYQDNATRKSGAISYLLYTSFRISTNNAVEEPDIRKCQAGVFPTAADRRWSFSGEFGSFAGWNGAVFHDIDGSVGGVPDSYIVIDNGIADDPDKDCQNQAGPGTLPCVERSDMGRVQIGAGGAGGRGGPGAPGGPAGRPWRSWRSWRSCAWRSWWSRQPGGPVAAGGLACWRSWRSWR